MTSGNEMEEKLVKSIDTVVNTTRSLYYVQKNRLKGQSKISI